MRPSCICDKCKKCKHRLAQRRSKKRSFRVKYRTPEIIRYCNCQYIFYELLGPNGNLKSSLDPTFLSGEKK